MNFNNSDYNQAVKALAKAQSAQGLAQNTWNVPEAQPPSVVSDIFSRLSKLDATLGEVEVDLVCLNDRLFGPSPNAVGGAGGNSGNVLGGQYGELLLSLDRLIDRANSVLGASRNLNGRI